VSLRRLAAIALLAALAGCAPSQVVSTSETRNVLAWAMQQNMKPGTAKLATLPAQLVAFPVREPVTIARLPDGRYCFLLKTWVGWKENYRGVLSCSGPLVPGEIVNSSENGSGNRPYLSLGAAGGVFEEVYIQSQRDDRTFDVFFDLN